MIIPVLLYKLSCIVSIEVLEGYTEPDLAVVIGPRFSLDGFLPTLCKFTHFAYCTFYFVHAHVSYECFLYWLWVISKVKGLIKFFLLPSISNQKYIASRFNNGFIFQKLALCQEIIVLLTSFSNEIAFLSLGIAVFLNIIIEKLGAGISTKLLLEQRALSLFELNFLSDT